MVAEILKWWSFKHHSEHLKRRRLHCIAHQGKPTSDPHFTTGTCPLGTTYVFTGHATLAQPFTSPSHTSTNRASHTRISPPNTLIIQKTNSSNLTTTTPPTPPTTTQNVHLHLFPTTPPNPLFLPLPRLPRRPQPLPRHDPLLARLPPRELPRLHPNRLPAPRRKHVQLRAYRHAASPQRFPSPS